MTDTTWRTLTFGDLRPGDVIRTDQDGPEETVRTARGLDVVCISGRPPVLRLLVRTDLSVRHPSNNAPVLVRHPRPQGDET